MQTIAERIELSNPDAYRQKLFSLLGQVEPLVVLSKTADALAGIIAEHSPAKLRRRPFEGKWTPNEVIGHLMDTEWVFGYRIRTILCDDRPTIIGMDQEKWVAVQQHNEREPRELIENFRAMRTITLGLLRRITPTQQQRVGLHSERGEESIGLMMKMIAGHDLSHLDQIRRYLAALDGK